MTHKLSYSCFLIAMISGCLISCKPDASSPAKGAKQIYLSLDGQFTVDTIARGLQIPFGIDWLPDGRMIFTERGRKDSSISIMDSTGKIRQLCMVPSVDIDGQGG